MVASADVIVMGAGCMGLFLAEALKQAGRSVVVVDRAGPLGYASIRNLGWLQSGALEATQRNADPDHVQQFRDGYRALMSRFPSAVGTTPGAFFYPLRSAERASRLKDAWSSALHLTARSPNDLLEVTLAGRIDDLSHICVGVEDRAFDSHAILEQLAADTFDDCTAGFAGIEELERLSLEQIANGWQVTLGDHVVARGRACVVASGIYSAMIARRFELDLGESEGFVRYTVGALAATLCSGVVAFIQPRGPSLIPQPPGSPSHTLVYFAGSDRPDMSGQLLVTDQDRADFLANFLTWFSDLARRPPIPCELYSCLRFKSVHGVKHRFIDRGLVFAYPSYFTLAPVAAHRCAEELLTYLAHGAPLPLAGTAGRPTYARQFFARAPESRLRWNEGRFVLEPMTGHT
jgi:glycine/D-amino acid oxidase-like deaminating enzyme